MKPVDDTSCRLIARSRAEQSPAAADAYVVFIELPPGIMQRKKLLDIRQRTEAHLAAENPARPSRLLWSVVQVESVNASLP